MTNNKTILIIEDERGLQKTLSDTLIGEGFKVANALDGEIGLALARQEKPDLILLDLILPKKDGFQVLKELKADDKTKDIKVIVLTNLESNADVDRVLAAGATTYLVKANYSLDDVIKKVKETLD